MSNKKNDKRSESGLPDRNCLIILNGNVQTITNLDDYPDEQLGTLISQAIDKYGKENVRFARIAFINVQTSIKIDIPT